MKIRNRNFNEQKQDNGCTYYDERFEAEGYNIYITKVIDPDGKVDYIDIQGLALGQYYLPEIRYHYGPFTRCKEFKVQTTAYGSLPTNEIENVVKGYRTALKVVKYLKEHYGLKEEE